MIINIARVDGAGKLVPTPEYPFDISLEYMRPTPCPSCGQVHDREINITIDGKNNCLAPYCVNCAKLEITIEDHSSELRNWKMRKSIGIAALWSAT
jgi:hypothetical protein